MANFRFLPNFSNQSQGGFEILSNRWVTFVAANAKVFLQGFLPGFQNSQERLTMFLTKVFIMRLGSGSRLEMRGSASRRVDEVIDDNNK